MALADALADLQGKIGEDVHVSEWITVTQEVIDMFANATNDHQWIHVDEKRAKVESPYGTTIAHGYLTLSLYPALRGLVNPDAPVYPGVTGIINYGINKLRFTNAVKVNSRIRARSTLVAVEEIKNRLHITEKYTAEIEGEDRPACIAECIMLWNF